jgi:hypothetical protein
MLQGITGQELSLRGSVDTAKLELIESLCRQCRDEVAVASRESDNSVSSWEQIKGTCTRGGETLSEAASSLKSTCASIGGASSAVSQGAYAFGRGIASAPSQIRGQAVREAQMTQDMLRRAKTWALEKGKAKSKEEQARDKLESELASATGEKTEDLYSEVDQSEVDLRSEASSTDMQDIDKLLRDAA